MPHEDQEAIRAKSITVFDDFSSELILCIFQYLSVADRYKSFFEYDLRLSQLVKRWTLYSPKELDADIVRFSTFHGWYKTSLENGGQHFFIYPRQGQQSRCKHPDDVTDTTNLHWWFIHHDSEPIIADERVRKIIIRHSFRLSPFFSHDEMGTLPESTIDDQQSICLFYGGDVIVNRNKGTHLESWLKSNHPDHADRILNRSLNPLLGIDELCAPIFEAEWLKATKTIRDAAHQVWKELKSVENVNPLEIRASNV